MNPELALPSLYKASSVPVRSHKDDKAATSASGGQPALAPDFGSSLRRRPTLDTRRSSTISTVQIERIVSEERADTNTYGVSELREGFFDALFLKPPKGPQDDLKDRFEATLPEGWKEKSPLRPRILTKKQWDRLRGIVVELMTTREGVRLLKTFTAFFTAYALCLVPSVHNWLGNYSYIMAVSTILNHPARSFGSQIDGAVLTIVGTGAGLGWGIVGLLLSTSTIAARAGFGGILALFLALFMTTMGWMRSFFLRFYQCVLCAGIAIMCMTLAETNDHSVEWSKVRSYGISWVLGQAIALAVNCLIWPDAGARPLAITFHDFFGITKNALEIPSPRDNGRQRRLAQSYVDLSQAHRDLRLDLTITRFRPDDVEDLRNLMQGVIRALLSMDTETYLVHDTSQTKSAGVIINMPEAPGVNTADFGLSNEESVADLEDVSTMVLHALSKPLREVLDSILEGLDRSDAALMDLSGYRKYIGPPMDISADVGAIQIHLNSTLSALNDAEITVFQSNKLTSRTMQAADIVQLFLFVRHTREAADAVQSLLDKVEDMQQMSGWPRLNFPSYSFWKAIHRANRQTRHDRGGITAGSYHFTFVQIADLLESIKSKEHKPTRTRANTPEPEDGSEGESMPYPIDSHPQTEDPDKADEDGVGRKIWRILRHLQGFEGRYALKVCIVTSLLSVPSYLDGREWWDRYHVWWAVAASWIMIHPRVGGNVQDLFTRSFCAILGAIWAGAAQAAGKGNPYVTGVFSAIFMIPMLYRFVQSSHPRSGLIGCLSFTVVSLSLHNRPEGDSAVTFTIAMGLCFFVGTAVPILVNWVLWPFVARHELRSAMSSMIFFMSIIYRNVVAKYVYFEEGKEPTALDIQKSEQLEGHIREGFLRIRQLLELTRHEIRLRAPFDPLPYSALADACERFFDYLIAVRQAALFYNPGYIRDNPVASEKLLGYRRDAVAAILGNLYILAGALRSQRKVPRYLPNAGAARRKLLLRTIEIEDEIAAQAERIGSFNTRWSDIHSFSFNESLTGCIAQLEELEELAKLIVGEQGFDDDLKEDAVDQLRNNPP
ncbi:unnamed protein product [Clonostachys rosea f. rosea IK726]|uniref:Uncharacterized protein n=1 Tax=Clonostachys rosea f. rosea IK726 TaxID=1349383 RepID=A0ACA9TSI4_BIOOC|nr:unnamed protein product [Clonostachys rosea f. rosea IK726]